MAARLGLLFLFLAANLSHAADAPVPYSAREIAFVQSLVGTWKDTTYTRPLTQHLTICSDSLLIRVNGRRASSHDQVVLQDLFGGKPITFKCSELLNCAHPIQLAEIAAKIEQALKGKNPIESWREFKKHRSGQTSTISTLSLSFPTDTLRENVWFKVAVVRANQPLLANSISPRWKDQIPIENLEGDYSLEFCPDPENQVCKSVFRRYRAHDGNSFSIGTKEPDPIVGKDGALPFGRLVPGLHRLKETASVDGDILTRSAFVLAVEPSLQSKLEQIRISLALAWMDPDASTDELSDYVLYVASVAARGKE